MRIGVLGLGAIGSICAGHVAAKSGAVAVYDLDCDRTAALADTPGVTTVDSVAELGRAVDAVVVSLPNPTAVRDALLDSDGLLSAGPRDGLLIIDMSTVDPQTSRDIAAAAATRGARYLDAPVSGGQPFHGGVDGAAAGTLTFMVGGDGAAFTDAIPVLSLLGVKWHHVGPAGSGSTVKLISNLMSGVYTLVAAEGFALGAAAGFTPQQLITVFRDTDAKSFFLTDYLYPRLEEGRLEPGFTVDLQVKDHRLAAELGHGFGIPLLFNAVAIQLYEQMRRAGRGSRDVTDAINFWAENAGVDLASPTAGGR
jgi:3-hydroxyisobutyrate dehydrogenase-like beta-hydroxyacid dehydrogenase